MIRAALAATILGATLLVGNAQAEPKPQPDPCTILNTCFPWPFPKAQASPVKQSVTPSIPIPPPVRSR